MGDHVTKKNSDVAHRKIFIGGLSYNTDDDKLRQYYSQYGEVHDAVVMKDPVSRRSRGFGFITFFDLSSVDRALAIEHTIDNRKVEVKRAVPRSEVPGSDSVYLSAPQSSPKLSAPSKQVSSTSSSSSNNKNSSSNGDGVYASDSYAVASNTPKASTDSGSKNAGSHSQMDAYAYNKIFVGGLHYDTRDAEFRNYFEKYGKVVTAEVMFNRETHKSRGFGFIIYELEKSAETVCLDKEHVIDGKVVEVKRAIPKSKLSPSTFSVSTSNLPASKPPVSSPGGSNLSITSPNNLPSIRKDVRRTASAGSAPPSFTAALSGSSSTAAVSLMRTTSGSGSGIASPANAGAAISRQTSAGKTPPAPPTPTTTPPTAAPAPVASPGFSYAAALGVKNAEGVADGSSTDSGSDQMGTAFPSTGGFGFGNQALPQQYAVSANHMNGLMHPQHSLYEMPPPPSPGSQQRRPSFNGAAPPSPHSSSLLASLDASFSNTSFQPNAGVALPASNCGSYNGSPAVRSISEPANYYNFPLDAITSQQGQNPQQQQPNQSVMLGGLYGGGNPSASPFNQSVRHDSLGSEFDIHFPGGKPTSHQYYFDPSASPQQASTSEQASSFVGGSSLLSRDRSGSATSGVGAIGASTFSASPVVNSVLCSTDADEASSGGTNVNARPFSLPGNSIGAADSDTGMSWLSSSLSGGGSSALQNPQPAALASLSPQQSYLNDPTFFGATDPSQSSLLFSGGSVLGGSRSVFDPQPQADISVLGGLGSRDRSGSNLSAGSTSRKFSFSDFHQDAAASQQGQQEAPNSGSLYPGWPDASMNTASDVNAFAR